MQDAAAALPAKLFGDIAGKTVYDLCAAPGGKTAQLAAAGAKVTSLDRSERRLRRLTANLERLNLWADTLTADAATWKPDELADAVLLDAPCSATGAIRRHPDIMRLKSQEDVTKLAGAQRRLLAHAVDLVSRAALLSTAPARSNPRKANSGSTICWHPERLWNGRRSRRMNSAACPN